MSVIEDAARRWHAALKVRWSDDLAWPREEPQYTDAVRELHEATKALYLLIDGEE